MLKLFIIRIGNIIIKSNYLIIASTIKFNLTIRLLLENELNIVREWRIEKNQ